MTIQRTIYTQEELHIKRLNELATNWKKAKARGDIALAKIYLSHFKFLLGGKKQ